MENKTPYFMSQKMIFYLINFVLIKNPWKLSSMGWAWIVDISSFYFIPNNLLTRFFKDVAFENKKKEIRVY